MRLTPPTAPASTTKKAKPNSGQLDSDKQLLSNALLTLQESAAVVSSQIYSTNKAVYRHLVELYLWWREANGVEGYLDAAYAGTGKKYKKKIKNGINFAPLFWLTWGFDNGLTDDKAGRWSRVLNALHVKYEGEEQYKTDSIPKLQNYIEQSGGVDGLVDYGSKDSGDLDEDEIDDDTDGCGTDWLAADREPQMTVDEMLAKLYASANSFYSAAVSPSTVTLNATLPLTADEMSVVLVRKIGNQYQLIGASSDETFVKPVAMQTYLQDFSAIPNSLRTIVETIATQCLPKHLQSFYARLTDTAPKDIAKTGKKSIRRLLYQHATGQFILSPIRASSGVVTLAKPKQAVLENATCDVFLSTHSRRAVERRMVSGRDINLYTPVKSDVVPAYRLSNLASHAMRVQNQFAPTDYMHLDFWPFYDNMPTPRGQLLVAKLKPNFGTWRITLTLAWFRKFALEFSSLWLQSHGTHITRQHQNVFLLAFGLADLTVHFVCHAGKFEQEQTVDFDGVKARGNVLTVCVLSKDFAVAMQAIADLCVVTDIQIEVDEHVLALTFSTTAADYRLFIPTCTIEGTRNEMHFVQYEPEPCLANVADDYNDQAEGDFDPEQ